MSVIKVDSLTVAYTDKPVLDKLSVDIKLGKVTTIIGENGCGKSTLLKTIGRIITPQNGNIIIDGKNVHKTSTVEIAKMLAMLPQSPIAPFGLTVREVIEYGRFPHQKGVGKMSNQDHSIVDNVMKQTNLTELADREVSALSGGQRQRVWIAMALAQNTDIILLDEPTTYLDMAFQLEVLEIVQELNRKHNITIVMVLHDINHASRFSDELILLKKGNVVAKGTPEETVTNENLKTVFNIDAKIIKIDDYDKPVCITYDLL